MGSDIVSRMRDVASLLARLRERADAGRAGELVDLANALQRDLALIAAHGKRLGSPKPADQVRARQALRQVELAADTTDARALAAASITADAEPRDTIEIESFFEQVSDSLVKTQERLNAVSLDYVAQLDPRIAPAYFTIPSLKAELKVGFNTSGGDRLNLILFSREREKKAFGESTVTFEMVAAPPPPGEAPFGALNLPTPRFMVLGDERKRWLDAAREAAKEAGKNLGTMYDNTEQAGLAQVVRFEPSDEDREAARARCLVVWPAQQANVKDPHKWRELLVMQLVGDAQGIRLDAASPFRSGAASQAVQASSADPAAADLGDALCRVAVALRDWARATRLDELLPPSVPSRP